MLTLKALITSCFVVGNILTSATIRSHLGFVEAFSPIARVAAKEAKGGSHFSSMTKKAQKKISQSWKKSERRSHSSSPPSRSRNYAQNSDNVSIESMLMSMTDYFYSMVDPRTNRFYYRCLPESKRLIHTHCPIRDLGSAWDTANLLNFLSQPKNTEPSTTLPRFVSEEKWSRKYPRLSNAILETIKAFSEQWIQFEDESTHRNCVAIPNKVLQEASNIAHSAFMILATVGAMRLSIAKGNIKIPLDEVANGILFMQKENGAFAIHFGDADVFRGIEFYPGEAMLALLDAYQFSLESNSVTAKQNVLSAATLDAIILAAKRAFLFYSDYYRRGNVDPSYTGFFANWQVQSFARLHDILHDAETQVQPKDSVPPLIYSKEASGMTEATTDQLDSASVSDYVFELCDAVTASTPWQALLRGQYRSLSTVEIACGLEAIAEGTLVALKQSSQASRERVDHYVRCMNAAVCFLAAVQNQVPTGAVGSGGLGYGLQVSEQRLDVTGHAVNALIKVHEVKKITETRSTPDEPTARNAKSSSDFYHCKEGDSHSDPGPM